MPPTSSWAGRHTGIALVFLQETGSERQHHRLVEDHPRPGMAGERISSVVREVELQVIWSCLTIEHENTRFLEDILNFSGGCLG